MTNLTWKSPRGCEGAKISRTVLPRTSVLLTTADLAEQIADRGFGVARQILKVVAGFGSHDLGLEWQQMQNSLKKRGSG